MNKVDNKIVLLGVSSVLMISAFAFYHGPEDGAFCGFLLGAGVGFGLGGILAAPAAHNSSQAPAAP